MKRRSFLQALGAMLLVPTVSVASLSKAPLSRGTVFVEGLQLGQLEGDFTIEFWVRPWSDYNGVLMVDNVNRNWEKRHYTIKDRSVKAYRNGEEVPIRVRETADKTVIETLDTHGNVRRPDKGLIDSLEVDVLK